MAESATTTLHEAHSRAEQPSTGVAPRRLSPVLLIGIVAAALMGGAYAARFFLPDARLKEGTVSEGAPGSALVVVPLEGFTVNLADPEENHFLRVTVDLALARMPAPVDAQKPASGLPVARIRDAMLGVLTASTSEALLTPGGKQQLKRNLLEALHHSVPELDVRDVYFTEFLVQR